MAGDRLVRTMSANGEVSARVITGTALVAESASVHSTSPVATTALGRTLLCALLLASGRKEGDTLQIQFRGAGPLGGVTAIATAGAGVRGYVGSPKAVVPLTPAGTLDVPAAIGPGILAVVRNSAYAKQPYTGLVRISSGEVAQDVAQYLLESEQIPSAMSAGVRLGAGGEVVAAGGFLVQLLPGASEESVRILERNVRSLPPVTEMLVGGESPKAICDMLMRDLDPMMVLESPEPRYACTCGVDRLKRTISLLPKDEVEEILAKEKKIEGKCCDFFCCLFFYCGLTSFCFFSDMRVLREEVCAQLGAGAGRLEFEVIFWRLI